MNESKPMEQKKDEPLDKVFNELKIEFNRDESIEFSMEKLEFGAAFLSITFIMQDGVNAIDGDLRNNIIQKINKVLSKNQFEYRNRGMGGLYQLLLIDPKFIDGKINWRRWVPRGRITEFSETEISQLDEIADYVELSDKIEERAHDDYGRFNCFLRLSPLTTDEKKRFENSVLTVFR